MRMIQGWMTVVVVLLLAAACRMPGTAACPVGETRCAGSVAEQCDPGGRWQTLLDCDRVSALSGTAFVCAPVVVEDDAVGRLPGHTCVPAQLAGDSGEGGAP